jgi:hypothetical protein
MHVGITAININWKLTGRYLVAGVMDLETALEVSALLDADAFRLAVDAFRPGVDVLRPAVDAPRIAVPWNTTQHLHELWQLNSAIGK